MKMIIAIALIVIMMGTLTGCVIVGAEFAARHDGARVEASLAGMSTETEVKLPLPAVGEEVIDEGPK